MSHPLETLTSILCDRLEKTPVEFVTALFELLAAPERKRDEHLQRDLLLLIWLLLESPESFTRSENETALAPDTTRFSQSNSYEQLVRFLCDLIEGEIICHFPPSQASSQFFTGKASHLFWGGLALHLKLALPLEPLRGRALCFNDVVILSNGESFPCEFPLSESQIHALLLHLGQPFIVAYFAAYIHSEQLQQLIALLHAQSKQARNHSMDKIPRLELLIQERTLNRYIDKFAKCVGTRLCDGCKRLADNLGNPIFTRFASLPTETVLSRILAESSSVLFIEHKQSESFELEFSARRKDAHIQTNKPIEFVELATVESINILEQFQHSQKHAIRDALNPIFILPELSYRSPNGASRITAVSELANTKNIRIIITAAPGAGKTRLLQEILLSEQEPQVYQIYLNLCEYGVMGFRSFHHSAAIQISKQLDKDYRFTLEMENELMKLDANRKIIWLLDGFDEISPSDLPTLMHNLTLLPQFFLATSNSLPIIERLKQFGVPPNAVVTIQPFTQTQVADFIAANRATLAAKTNAQRRALQLPGLARLPDGLKYICTNPQLESVIDVLVSYICSNLNQLGEPFFNLLELCESANGTDVQSETMTAMLYLAAALGKRRTRDADLIPFSLDEILPYMGQASAKENRQRALECTEKAVRAGFLQANEKSDSFCFVIPEIGNLLMAFVTLKQFPPRRWVQVALQEFVTKPSPMHEMMLALAAWHQEKLLLLHSPLAAD